MIKKLTILYIALCVSTPSAFAQKKGLVKGVAEALSSKTPSAVSAQMERQVARATLGAQLERQLASQITQYHPVFGYTLPTKLVLSHNLDLRTPFRSAEMDPTALIQVKPILDKRHIQTAFEMYKELDLPQTTEMAYLWRLANPSKDLAPDLHHAALTRLNNISKHSRDFDFYENKLENLPNMRFLKMLMDPIETPYSYAELWSTITCYPKHITLNEYGFPVKTKYANYAKELDLYLILSNPKEMGVYNNAGKYTPLVLTEEEHIAADELLALRLREEKIPENPTPRDLLDIAYNRLETHTIPYTEVKLDATGRRWSVDADYKAYPNYKNTRLYRTIKGMIETEDPYSYSEGQDLSHNQLDMLHLIVLDAVMGGVETDNLEDVNRALIAFSKLCTSVPQDQQAHVSVLKTNLKVVFEDLMHFNLDNKIDWADPSDPRSFKAVVAKNAQFLLNDIRIYQ